MSAHGNGVCSGLACGVQGCPRRDVEELPAAPVRVSVSDRMRALNTALRSLGIDAIALASELEGATVDGHALAIAVENGELRADVSRLADYGRAQQGRAAKLVDEVADLRRELARKATP